jgi:hypothetical protein
MEEFMWDGCGDALGSLKNEADDHLKDCGLAKDEINRLEKSRAGCSILMRSSWVGVSSIASGKRGAMILQNVKDTKKVKVRNSPSRTSR